MLLAGKIAVVTGAGSIRGIGRATCQLFAEHGAQVVALDLDGAAAEATARELGPPHLGFACDIINEDDCRRAGERAAELGGADALVHCAGIAEPLSLDEMTKARYDRMIDVNLWGTIQIVKALAPKMSHKGRGAIVCLSSLAAQRGGGFVGGLHYAAAKAGVLGFVRGLARELGPAGVRVNAVAPGLVDTDMTAPFMAEDIRRGLAKQAPLGRLASAREVAGACLFLASDLAGYVTGTTLDVNGGLHIH
jgi:NAD(P)-dependent dehydrogenase (short-subunit alcohol dehydrogenase family)